VHDLHQRKEKIWEKEESCCVCAKIRGRSAGAVYYTCSDLGELEEEMACHQEQVPQIEG
jgi:hypothetical protein